MQHYHSLCFVYFFTLFLCLYLSILATVSSFFSWFATTSESIRCKQRFLHEPGEMISARRQVYKGKFANCTDADTLYSRPHVFTRQDKKFAGNFVTSWGPVYFSIYKSFFISFFPKDFSNQLSRFLCINIIFHDQNFRGIGVQSLMR